MHQEVLGSSLVSLGQQQKQIKLYPWQLKSTGICGCSDQPGQMLILRDQPRTTWSLHGARNTALC